MSLALRCSQSIEQEVQENGQVSRPREKTWSPGNPSGSFRTFTRRRSSAASQAIVRLLGDRDRSLGRNQYEARP